MWARVAASIRPIDARRRLMPEAARTPAKPAMQTAALPPVAKTVAKPTRPGLSLDGTWDRKLSRGAVVPDMTLDLHGHTLATAHAALDHGLARARAQGVRVILLITGRPPAAASAAPHARGAIRAAIGDWLALSSHAGAIAAVRNAHPRHGGGGALYIIMRRPRD